jgi:predicted small lipoprotein YifL
MTPRTAIRALALAALLAAAVAACGKAAPPYRTFDTPEHAVQALIEAAKSSSVDGLVAIFGPDSRDLVASADAVAAKRNRDVFVTAVTERWSLADEPSGSKTLVIGNEEWPFPIPLARDGDRWRFDTAAGKEEVVARRIGRNELAAIRISQTYVGAQRLYAEHGHDGAAPGAFAAKFRSDSGRQNGLYWPARPGERRSPLGDLVAYAAQEGRTVNADSGQPAPFHGYYFRILTAQGPAAEGGAKEFMANGQMTGGFALVAWPAVYDTTGVMTFIVGPDGVLREKDLGADTEAAAAAMRAFDPDPSWQPVR